MSYEDGWYFFGINVKRRPITIHLYKGIEHLVKKIKRVCNTPLRRYGLGGQSDGYIAATLLRYSIKINAIKIDKDETYRETIIVAGTR